MKKKILYLSFSGMFVLFMAMTCENSDDPATLEVGAPAPEYTPLSIQAEVTRLEPEYIYKGRLDENLVTYFLMSACADLLDPEKDPVTYQTCLTLKESTVPADNCDVWFCTMQITLCAGNFAMEIAEAADVKELPEIPLDLVMTQDGSFIPASEKGIFDVVNERLNGVENLPRYRIRIPPQSAEDKTIAIRLGMLGFYMAGIHGAEQLLYKEEDQTHPGEDYYKCLDGIFNPASVQPGIEMVNSEGETVTKADVFSVTYGEAVRNYAEASQALVQNTIAVGDSQFSREMDFSKASTLAWVGVNDPFAPPMVPLENSRLGALVTLAGGLGDGARINPDLFNLVDKTAVDSPHNFVRECTQPVDKDSIKAATQLLQASAVASSLKESTNDEDVVKDMMIVFASRFSHEGLMPEGTEHPMPVGEFLEDAKITLADVHEARAYLKEEARSYHRPIIEEGKIPYDGGEVTTIFGLGNMNKPLPGAFLTGKLASSPSINHSVGYDCSITDSYGLECPYAATSASTALDFMRRAASVTLSGGRIPAEHAALFKEVEIYSEDISGKKIVESQMTPDGEGNLESIAITVHGMDEGENIQLYFSDEGFYCVNYGNIAGAPCDARDYRLDAAASAPEPDDDLFPGKLKVTFTLDGAAMDTSRLRDMRANGSGSDLGSSEDSNSIHVFTSLPGAGSSGGGGAPLQLVTRITTPESITEARRVYMPSMGAIQDLAQGVIGKSQENCAYAKLSCAGLPYDLVPPLENELTEDADPYENSWRHYLNLARQKADRADALGEELIQAGLEMDQRAEGAMEDLEGLCGEIDIDPSLEEPTLPLDWLTGAVNISDPGLLSCLGQAYCPEGNSVPCGRKTVTLGSNTVCVVRDRVTEVSGIHAEHIDYDPDHPELGKCVSKDSPFLIYKGNISVCNFESPYLADVVLNEEGDEVFDEEGYKVVDCIKPLMDHVLVDGICASTDETGPCDYIVETVTEKDKQVLGIFKAAGSASEPRDCSSLVHIPSAEELQSFADDSDLLDPYKLSSNLRLIEFDEDIGRYFKLSMIGAEEPIFGVLPDPEDPEDPEGGLNSSKIINPQNLEKLIRGGYADYSPLNIHGRHRLDTRIARIIMQLSQLIMQNPSVILGKNEGCNFINVQLDEDPYYVMTCPQTSSGKVGQCAEGVSDLLCGNAVTCCDGDNRVDWDSCEIYGCGEITYPEVAQYNIEVFKEFIRNYYYTEKLSELFIEWERMWCANSYTQIIFDQDNGDYRSLLEGSLCASLLYNTFCFSVLENHYYTSTEEAETCEMRCECLFYPSQLQTNLGDQRRDILDVLYFICGLSNIVQNYELDCLHKELPEVRTLADLNKVSKYLQCAGDEITRKASRIIIPNMPELVIDAVASGRFETSYPATGGQYLDQVNRIQVNLNVFQRLTNDMSETLFQMSNTVELAQYQMQLAEINGEIGELETEKAIIQEAAAAASGFLSAIGSFFSGDFGGAMGSASNAAVAAATLDIDIKIKALKKEGTETQKSVILAEHMGKLHSDLTNLQNTFVAIQDAFLEIISAVNDLDAIQRQAKNDYTKALMLGSDSTGKVYPVNTTMRRRYNTLQKRYLAALEDARKMAFVARKAIEFRLGVDLKNVHRATLVEPPSSWADDVCRLEGIDYEKISREDPKFEIINDYAESYIGDYVTKLENFVESYSFDHPFSDADDLAVISLKDDVMQEKSTCGPVESPNRLYFSEDFGRGVPRYDESGEIVSMDGWQMKGCQSPGPECNPETEQCYDVCLQVMEDRLGCLDPSEPNNVVCDGATLQEKMDEFYSRADLIRDVPYPCDQENPLECPRIEGYPNTGYVSQAIPDLGSGWYILSWHDMFPQLSSPAQITYTNDYTVAVNAEGLQVYSDTMDACSNCTATSEGYDIIMNESIVPYEWSQRVYILHLDSAAPLEIQVHPSTADDAFGLVWLAAMQLDAFDPSDPDLPEPPAAVPPGVYYQNEDQRIVFREGCRDVSGAKMRSRFNKVCPSTAAVPTPLEYCYYEFSFGINLDEIENGKYLTSNAIAINNYNYRHNTVSVNFVGTNIRDCTAAPTSCYSNGYVPYSFIQGGAVQVRNHEGQEMDYVIPDGRIEYGKGLAAEVTVTNPLNSSMETMLAAYQNSELRGRPIQGTYTIRIYEVPELQWSHVEDIQFIWNYHYWTKFGVP